MNRSAFNRDVFYEQLDEVYEQRDVDAIERFLLDTQRSLAQERAEAFPACDLCITPQMADSLNSGYIRNLLTVQNELLSLYRGVNRFAECLQISSVMKEEMKDLGLLKTEPYAILLLNEGTAYRMMGEWDKALEDFDLCESILTVLRGADPFTLASLYNNRAPVLMQRGRETKSRDDLEQAVNDLHAALAIVRGAGNLKREEAVTLCGIAEAYALLGDDESGEKAADEAVSIYRQAGQDSHAGAAFNAKARFLFKRKAYAQAAELFREAARITRSYYGENNDYKICIANAQKAEEAAAASTS